MGNHQVFENSLMEPEDIYQLFYDSDTNMFTDEGGYIVYNIFEYITPNDLMLFKKNKVYTMIIAKDGNLVEMFYLFGGTFIKDFGRRKRNESKRKNGYHIISRNGYRSYWD